ncbi:hypothetical protein Tsubulata_029844 [Turnera subulata]|uniref:Bifunctional inhibitor/plant lipid transfer protein/seed storage helical domain-containing protein n=1 Tax=Turnera subulata TaxID=218843 RepID=A0A9Q0FGP9_9ROSI|nr:hypothetical protein Tsubulata_029844 [Turnera subulata]
MTSPRPPTPMCCSKLRDQKPCLCQYVKNHHLQKLVNSPNAKKAARICRSPFPKC